MKSTVKEFVYVSEKGETKVRKVFLMNATDTHIQGFEMSYLSKTQQRLLKNLLAYHDVHNTFASKQNPSSTQIPGLNLKWIKKAWRTFKIENVSTKMFTKKQLAEMFVMEGKAKNMKAALSNINDVLSGRRNRKTAYGLPISKAEEGLIVLK